MKHFETAMLAFGLMLIALPVARAADTTCPPSPPLGSTVNGNLIVPPNQSCELDDGTVTGNVVVGTGASLGVFPGTGQTVTIHGNVAADRCNFAGVQTFGEGVVSVGGNFNIQNCTNSTSGNGYTGISFFSVTIGGNFLCANNAVCDATGGVVQGNLTVDNNTAAVNVGNSQISGNADVSGNSGRAPVLENNRIGGNLRCFDNNPPASNFGSPNTVSGNEQGQCAGL
jgi:hypothetical protein